MIKQTPTREGRRFEIGTSVNNRGLKVGNEKVEGMVVGFSPVDDGGTYWYHVQTNEGKLISVPEYGIKKVI